MAEKGLAKNRSDLSFVSQALADEERIAAALAEQGDHAAAAAMARRAIDRAEHLTAPSEKDRVANYISRAYFSLAAVEAKFGNRGEAQAAAARAVAGWRQSLESGSKLVNSAELAMAEALLSEPRQ